MAQARGSYVDKRIILAVALVVGVAVLTAVFTGVWVAGVLVAALGLAGVSRRIGGVRS
jgi:hypothetical protein